MNDLNLEGLTDAQVRLFAVRCARRVQHLMTDPRSIAALDVAERYAKGEATDKELSATKAAAWAASAAWAAAAAWAASGAASDAAWSASDAAWSASSASGAASGAAAWAASAAWDASDAAWAAEREAQQKILDEIKQEQPR